MHLKQYIFTIIKVVPHSWLKFCFLFQNIRRKLIGVKILCKLYQIYFWNSVSSYGISSYTHLGKLTSYMYVTSYSSSVTYSGTFFMTLMIPSKSSSSNAFSSVLKMAINMSYSLILTYGCLVQYEYSIKEIKIPNSRDKSQTQSTGEQSHEPLIYILLGLNVLGL